MWKRRLTRSSAPNINDPYDLLGTARGTYLEGYGAVFTVEMNRARSSAAHIGPPFGKTD